MTETKPHRREKRQTAQGEDAACYRDAPTLERLARVAASSLQLEGFEVTSEQLLEASGQHRK